MNDVTGPRSWVLKDQSQVLSIAPL